MKHKNWFNPIIALTVVFCSIVLLSAMVYAVYGIGFQQSGTTIKILFKDVTGVKKHTEVRYAGAVAGTVTDIKILQPGEMRNDRLEYKVEVTAVLSKDLPSIPVDVTAGLGAESLLGEKFLALTGGSNTSEYLTEGQVLLAESGDPVTKVNELLSQVNQDYPGLISHVDSLLEKANTLMDVGHTMLGNVDKAVLEAGGMLSNVRNDYTNQYSQRVVGLLDKGQTLVTNVNQVVSNAHTTVDQATSTLQTAESLIGKNETNISELLKELRVVSQNLKVVSTYLKAVSLNLGERPARLIWGRKEWNLPEEEAILESEEPIIIESQSK